MRYIKFTLIILIVIVSCSKEKENSNHKPLANFLYVDALDHFELSDISKDVDGDVLTPKWFSMCDSIKIINPQSTNAYFNLPNFSDTNHLRIKLLVFDGHLSDSIFKDIKLPKNTLERSYGLGINLDSEHSNNDSYNWYFDQMNTGTYSSINCGPTSVTMAIKWVNGSFDKTPLDARNTYRSGGGWWYTDDIINYLNRYSVNNKTINIFDIDSIQRQIDLGNIAILCLDMYYIRSQEKNKWHLDKFYGTSNKGWGHFIVIKGYKVVDEQVFYEAYDPNSWGAQYNDGTAKGKDRYYRSQDLDSAVINWWNYAIIISKVNLKSSNGGVDITKITHKPGL